MFDIPGTNISIDKPGGFSLTETGSYLVDDANQLMIGVTVSAIPKHLDGEINQMAFHDIKDFKTKDFIGKIGYRVRHKHGGGYDGYSMIVEGTHHGQLFSIQLLAQSTGVYSENKMQLLKKALLSIKFNNNEINPTKAAGISFNVDGFKQFRRDVSNIMLTDANDNKILVIPIHFSPNSETEFLKGCESSAIWINEESKVFPEFLNSKSKFFSRDSNNGAYFCEIENDGFYQAWVAISKSMVNVLLISKNKNSEDKVKIRQAIENMRLLRK